MAEETGGSATKPGSWLGDAVEEFKKAPPAAKIGIVVAILAAAGIGYYEYSKNQSSSTQGGTTASPSVDTSGANASQYPTVPGGNTGNVPVLPGGLSPLYDPSGQLVAFEPTPTGTTGTGTTTTGTGTGTSTGGTTKKKKKSKSSSSSSSGSTSKGHTVKQHQANGSQHKPTISGNSGHTTKSNNKVPAPKNTGGSKGYVYTTKPGDTAQSLQAKFFPGSSGSNAQGNLASYGNNAKILTAKTVNPKTGAIKPGTKILA